jgi:hypothetical protein
VTWFRHHEIYFNRWKYIRNAQNWILGPGPQDDFLCEYTGFAVIAYTLTSERSIDEHRNTVLIGSKIASVLQDNALTLTTCRNTPDYYHGLPQISVLKIWPSSLGLHLKYQHRSIKMTGLRIDLQSSWSITFGPK